MVTSLSSSVYVGVVSSPSAVVIEESNLPTLFPSSSILPVPVSAVVTVSASASIFSSPSPVYYSSSSVSSSVEFEYAGASVEYQTSSPSIYFTSYKMSSSVAGSAATVIESANIVQNYPSDFQA